MPPTGPSWAMESLRRMCRTGRNHNRQSASERYSALRSAPWSAEEIWPDPSRDTSGRYCRQSENQGAAKSPAFLERLSFVQSPNAPFHTTKCRVNKLHLHCGENKPKSTIQSVTSFLEKSEKTGVRKRYATQSNVTVFASQIPRIEPPFTVRQRRPHWYNDPTFGR